VAQDFDYMSIAQKVALLFVFPVICFAQPSPTDALRSFNQQHVRGVAQNPSGVMLTIATADGRSTFRLSEVIRFKLTFSSQEVHVYTVELSGENAAGVSSDLVVIGPGMTILHSLPGFAAGFVCCDSKRRYLGHSPVAAPEAGFSLERLGQSRAVAADPLGLLRMKLQPGNYAIFAQTRNVMRGWPKSQKDLYNKLSDITVTSKNVVHITVMPDAP
jgi:hypothetical protein